YAFSASPLAFFFPQMFHQSGKREGSRALACDARIYVSVSVSVSALLRAVLTALLRALLTASFDQRAAARSFADLRRPSTSARVSWKSSYPCRISDPSSQRMMDGLSGSFDANSSTTGNA